jgi:hypothetical protein
MYLEDMSTKLKKALVEFDFTADLGTTTTERLVTEIYLLARTELKNLPDPVGATTETLANMIFSIRNAMITASTTQGQARTSTATRIATNQSTGTTGMLQTVTHFNEFLAMEVARDKWASSAFYKEAHHEGSIGFKEGVEPPHLNALVDPLRAILHRYPLTRS